MKTMTMSITCWTPEDRAVREQMIFWCQNAGIALTEKRLDERRFAYLFEETPATNQSSWSLLEAKLTFEDELQKARPA